MGLKRLSIINFQGIKAVDIEPSGSVVRIEGKNGEGKTSTLNAIGYALCGPRWAKAQGIEAPIRKGEKKATIEAIIPGYTVTRIITPKTESLQVKGENGVPVKSPQKVLDAIIGRLSFDPLAFSMMAPKDQRALLLDNFKPQVDPARLLEETGAGSGSGDPIDTDGLQSLIDEAFAERTEINRDLKKKTATVEAFGDINALPEEPLDAQAIQERIRENEDRRTRIEFKKRTIEENERRINQIDLKIKEWEQFIRDAKEQRKRISETIETDMIMLTDVAPPEDLDLSDELSKIEAHNAGVRRRAEAIKERAERDKIHAARDFLDDRIDRLRKLLARMMGEIDLGVPGLEITEDGVELRGVPLSQSSTSERMILGCRVAMATNPEIKVLRINDGSVLDSVAMGRLAAWAQETGAEVWIERVEDAPTGEGFYIEEGEIISIPEEVSGNESNGNAW